MLGARHIAHWFKQVFSLATFTVVGTMFDMNQCLLSVTRTRSISLSQ
jgi:hypothetical protein